MSLLESSPPQLRRGGAKRRGGGGQVNDFIEQHHPSLGLHWGFALSGSRFAASAFPSSTEERSLSLGEGFSLIELLITLVITLTVGMLLFHLFHHNERVVRDQAAVMEMQQTARVLAFQIADEIRMAGQEVPVYGSNWDAAMAEAVDVILPTSTSTRIDFRVGLSNTDTAVTGSSTLDIALYATRTLTVSDGSAFSTTLGTTWPSGKFVYIWGPTSTSSWAWVRAQLIHITSTTLMVTPQQSSNMNPTTHFTGLPTISLEEAVSIYLNGNSVRRATGTDMTNPAAPMWSPSNEIGQNCTNLNFIYYDKNGNIIVPATLASRNSIARVDIQLTAQTANALSSVN
jgi:Tfp pilus assembly protein PilV